MVYKRLTLKKLDLISDIDLRHNFPKQQKFRWSAIPGGLCARENNARGYQASRARKVLLGGRGFRQLLLARV